MMRKAHQSPNIIAKAPVSRNKTITDFPITRINMLHILYIMVTETSSDTISLPSHQIAESSLPGGGPTSIVVLGDEASVRVFGL